MKPQKASGGLQNVPMVMPQTITDLNAQNR
jgi:hypothetical protein